MCEVLERRFSSWEVSRTNKYVWFQFQFKFQYELVGFIKEKLSERKIDWKRVKNYFHKLIKLKLFS